MAKLNGLVEVPVGRLTAEKIEAAAKLNEGGILVAYNDGDALRMETERGKNPYVWRGGRWQEMFR